MPVTTRPHLRFPAIKEEVKTTVAELFAANPWSPDADPLAVVDPFVDRICRYYGVPVPLIEISPWITNRFSYRPDARFSLASENEAGKITLREFTLIDLLMALRRHINSHTGSRLDEHAWACSLYYAVKPVRFRRLAREGKMLGVSARATYKNETWDRLVEEGRADPYTGMLFVEEVSEETVAAATEYAEAIIEEEAAEGIANLSNFLAENDVVAGIPEATPTDVVEAMNRDQLRAEAARLNIPGRGTMLASELREAVRRAREGS